jgi:arylsulfatase A-like enzyme
MIRKDGYKLMVYPKINKILLFDLGNDPDEITDLSEDPEYAEKRNELFQALLELQKEVNDPLDISHINS